MTSAPEPSLAPSSLSAKERRELFRSTLAAVSRSFYLTLRFLPGGVQQPIALGYLLARLSDTVADSAGAPVAERLELLREMEQVLGGNRGNEGDAATFSRRFLQRLEGLLPSVPDAGEQRLIQQAAALLVLYGELAPEDRHDVHWVLGVILSGQILDLERFSQVKEGKAESITALATAAELEDYTWRVAGCVGEFWTRICFRHLPRYASLPMDEMVTLGVGFGKALQLVNILRDAPVDLRGGRCYLPADALAPHLPQILLTRPEVARPVVAHWERQCAEWLEQGHRYLSALRPWRLRLACFLPWAIARRTLRRMEQQPPLESPDRVKVPRREVKQIVLWGIVGALSPRLLPTISRRF